MLTKNTKLKLTEKEINTITYLSKSHKPVSVGELQEKVWVINLIQKLTQLKLTFID